MNVQFLQDKNVHLYFKINICDVKYENYAQMSERPGDEYIRSTQNLTFEFRESATWKIKMHKLWHNFKGISVIPCQILILFHVTP